jgi:hypothetical protein
VLTLERYRELFGYQKHRFTGVDYVEFYRETVEACGCECEIILANDPKAILSYTKDVLVCDIHTRARSKKLLKAAGAETVYGLDDILSESVDGSGYNKEYGLYGTNKATEDSVKLFPRDGQPIVDSIAKKLYEASGKHVEVMVYGDGAFKDPVGKIWELADPVVSPAFTAGLDGKPNEIKLKYLADELQKTGADDNAVKDGILQKIRAKGGDLVGKEESLGTTPRQLTDLLGSLCDLTSGSGDKGTPVILIQGYFDNLANA